MCNKSVGDGFLDHVRSWSRQQSALRADVRTIVLSYTAASGFAPQSSSSFKSKQLSELPQHLAYNAGRILIYTVLGLVAGLFGGSIAFVGKLAGIPSAAIIVSGTLMIIAGILMFGSFRQPRAWAIGPSR